MRQNVLTADILLNKYFPVLDYGFVALTDYMGGDSSIEKFARVSYGNGTRKLSDTQGLIRYLVRNKHTTPLESTNLTFHIACPIHVMRQQIRHRAASVNEFSARYSVMPDISYTPKIDQVGIQSKNNKQGRSESVLDEQEYAKYLSRIDNIRKDSFSLYHDLLEHGVAREVARMDLPLSVYTYFYWEIDLHNLFHYLKLRTDPHAQWEIRQFANTIAGLTKEVAPIAFEAWYDYIYAASNLTRLDKLLHEFIIKIKLDDPMLYYKEAKEVIEHAELIGMSKREYEEFWDKFNIKKLTDFNLSLDDAKSPEYFEQIIKEHA